MLNVYSSADLVVNWNGLNLARGWAEDTFLTIEPNAERINYTVGADSQIAPSKNANKSATITVTYQQNAPVLKDIAKVMAGIDILGGDLPVSPFYVEDPNNATYFITANAFVTEVPTNEFGASQGERSFTFVCESYLLSDDPSTITSQFGDYINADPSTID